MAWSNIVVLLSLLTAGDMINRPVYKIVLTQKGYAQFLQYDIETPPLREFTFCIWIRVYNFGNDQSIFTYVANGSSRIVRLWLESGGSHMKVSINGRVISTYAVDIMKNVWRHVCLSYQSDFGAWALYIDARLVSCEAAQSLRGYILPGGGSVIIGYGTADNGAQNGFDGEIFGANMILASTIERNYTAKNNPLQEQKPFRKNKIKDGNRNSYVILNDIQTGEIHNTFENTVLPSFLRPETLNKSYIKIRTPYNYIEHDIGLQLTPKNSKTENRSKGISEFVAYKTPSSNNDFTDFWPTLNEAIHNNQIKSHKDTMKLEPLRSETKYLPTISEYETPPPISLNQKYTIHSQADNESNPLSIHIINDGEGFKPRQSFKSKIYKNEITEFETPPSMQIDTKVYGQWSRTKFAGNVLNYLKNTNFHKKEKNKTPPTIPLFKVSDSFPYASEYKLTKVCPPPFQFRRKNLIEKRYDIIKSNPQINVQILQDDLRNNIVKLHAETRPKQVQILNRGNPIKHDRRFYRNVDSQDTNENIYSIEATFKPKIFSFQNKNKHLYKVNLRTNNLSSVLSFLKSSNISNVLEDSANTKSKIFGNNQDMYSDNLSKSNKWHNVKSYNNDYTPRHINMNIENEMDKNKSALNTNIPLIRLNYNHENYKLEKTQDKNILKARNLATRLSNQSNSNTSPISLLKYNHGFLPTHERKAKKSAKHNEILSSNLKSRIKSENNFNKQIKIGNALNERLIIGESEEQNKVSFIGGDETIPDINRHRSEFDNDDGNVPASLGPRVCKNVELYDRVLYVQPDESIDMTHILSPIRLKNVGIEFIIHNYKKCSLTESLLEKSAILYINWSKTPVRLFGGAYPRTTTDLCGFF